MSSSRARVASERVVVAQAASARWCVCVWPVAADGFANYFEDCVRYCGMDRPSCAIVAGIIFRIYVHFCIFYLSVCVCVCV